MASGDDIFSKLVTNAEKKKAIAASKEFSGGGWRSKKVEGESTSADWRALVTKSVDDPNEPIMDALKSAGRVANAILNAKEDGKERDFFVTWAEDGQQNSLANDRIFLSPDVVARETTARPDWNFNERIDVLSADALTLASIKRTGDTDAEKKIAKDKASAGLWYTQESLNAETEVLNEYPGYEGLFAALRSYYCEPNAKQQIEERINQAVSMGKPDFEGALTALKWEMIYPDSTTALPENYRAAIDWAKDKVSKAETSMERADVSSEVTEYLKKLFPPEEEDGGGDGEDDKDGDEGEGEGSVSGLPDLPNIGQARESLGDGETNKSMPDMAGREVQVSEAPPSKENQENETKTPGRPTPPDEDTWKGGTTIEKVEPSESARALYRQRKKELMPQINQLKNRITLQAELLTFYHRGLKSGQIDDGSLFKAGIDEKDDNLFELKEIAEKPSIAIGLLLDESGSMGANNRYQAVRDVSIIIANALQSFNGLDLAVMGHTSDDHSGNKMLLRHYLTPKHRNIESLSMIEARSQNLDGYAMNAFYKNMLEWYPDFSSRHIFVVSDGLPCSYGYGGISAEQQMLRVCKKARREGVEIHGIGIDNAYTPEHGASMYGKGNCHVLTDVKSTMPTLGNWITKIIRSANALR